MSSQTPLYSWHVAAGARMTDFAGWTMPLHYGSILAEHQASRTSAGLFDLCHMTRVRIAGRDAGAFLDLLLPLNIGELKENAVAYSFFCDDRGGIIDDITLYKTEDYYMVVANASNRAEVLKWLREHKENFSVEIEDVTESLCMLALQGPIAEQLLEPLTVGSLSSIKYYHFALLQIGGARALISRTGYTGEDGFEIYCGSLYFRPIWERILEIGRHVGVVPVGLGARDLLRLEAAMPLYGHELTRDVTPIEAGLDKFISFEKKNFIGRTSMMHSSSSEFARRLVGFEMLDQAIPRAGVEIAFNSMPIGVATSGAFSPSLKRGIGMGYVDALKTTPGTEIDIIVRGTPHPARIAKRPFYRRPKKK